MVNTLHFRTFRMGFIHLDLLELPPARSLELLSDDRSRRRSRILSLDLDDLFLRFSLSRSLPRLRRTGEPERDRERDLERPIIYYSSRSC